MSRQKVQLLNPLKHLNENVLVQYYMFLCVKSTQKSVHACAYTYAALTTNDIRYNINPSSHFHDSPKNVLKKHSLKGVHHLKANIVPTMLNREN